MENLLYGDVSRKSELTGVPLYDAALALISLASATTVADINAIPAKGLALEISAAIAGNAGPELQLADLRARILENRPNLSRAWLREQMNSDTSRIAPSP